MEHAQAQRRPEPQLSFKRRTSSTDEPIPRLAAVHSVARRGKRKARLRHVDLGVLRPARDDLDCSAIEVSSGEIHFGKGWAFRRCVSTRLTSSKKSAQSMSDTSRIEVTMLRIVTFDAANRICALATTASIDVSCLRSRSSSHAQRASASGRSRANVWRSGRQQSSGKGSFRRGQRQFSS